MTSGFDPKSSVRRLAWRVGEAVHRRLADGDGRAAATGADRPPLPDPVGGQTAPTVNEAADVRSFGPVAPLRSVRNPVLTAAAVTDYGDPDFLADPFLFPAEDGGWHLFFEIFNRNRTPTGVIGCATTADAGRSWRYEGVVLETDVHLAFPYVFEWDGSYFLVPDPWNRTTPAPVRLYRADSLPGGWNPVATIVAPDRQLADCVVVRFDGRWWAIAGSDDGRHDIELYYSDRLVADDWTPHPANPVVSGRPRAARPAGRPVVGSDRVIAFFQDCARRYGDKVRAYEIERLSPESYADRERAGSPILEGSEARLGWNSGRMHHVDPWLTTEGWRCAVDGNIGWGEQLFGPDHWAIGLYRGGDPE